MAWAKVTTSTSMITQLSKPTKNITNHNNYFHYNYYYHNLHNNPLTNYSPKLSSLHHLNFTPFHLPSSSSSSINCRNSDFDVDSASADAAYAVLGVEPGCSAAQLKSAFRAKVKEFHPDVKRNGHESDMMIRRIIQAYETLSKYSRSEIIEREMLDPFDDPECEALDIFVNEIYCVGKGCPYSCVKQASHAFEFSSSGTARATSQGHGEDYRVQLAVGQCPRSCIHYVTPSQRIILEELLDSILKAPYDTSAEEDLLYGIIVKAKYENNRYQKPKKQPKVSTEYVDWV